MIQTIEKLKQQTLEKEADFSKCFNKFLELTANNQFLQAGQRLQGDDTFYKALLAPVTNFFGEEIVITTLFPVSIKQHHLIHGFAFLSNLQQVVFYFFDDIQCGIACAAKLENDISNFFRITLLQDSSSSTPLRH
jgi:hypothetical protein